MTLQIAVLVTQVPDTEALVRVESEHQLEVEDRWVCSFFDEIAVEAALGLRQAHPQAELVALSAGGRRAVDALRRAMAMGIDSIEHVDAEVLDDADSLTVARALAARLRQREPQLVLCGKQATDDEMGAVGPMVAELLGCPHVSAAVSLEVDPAAGQARVGRRVEGGIWLLEAPLPLVVTAEKGLADPHIPVVTRVMKAMRAQPDRFGLEELGLQIPTPGERQRRLRYVTPPVRPPVRMCEEPLPQNVQSLLEALRQAGVLG